jgi:hypothetical protein
MIGHDMFDVLTLLATWFSALGTVGAVIVALYFSLRETRQRLRVHGSIVNVVGMGQTLAGAPEYFNLSVTNEGHRDAVINGIQWKVGVIKVRRYVQIPSGPPLSPTLPHRLAPGASANFMFPSATFVKETLSIYKHSLRPLLDRKLRVGVWLSTGEDFVVRPDPTVFKEWKAAVGPPPKAAVG